MSMVPVWLDPDAPSVLADALLQLGYKVVGARVEQDSLTLAELASGADLPVGWSDEAGPGRYRLVRAEDDDPRSRQWFGFRVGAHAWKRFLHPPELPLFTAERDRQAGLRLSMEPAPNAAFAFLGVRPCDLAAIRVQDRVLLEGHHVDEAYAVRRKGAFVVVAECTEPGDTCFCTSFGTGPWAEGGFDVALTELVGTQRHGFVARAGSERGEALLQSLGGREATEAELDQRSVAITHAVRGMGRALDVEGARTALAQGPELPFWNDVAERCLSCANCTLVCPTCFCVTVEDRTDLLGRVAERTRRWDSCFSLDFSYLHGGSVRQSAAARYRQWLTHKLSSWFDQYGEAGCVGCGRCIAWCPVGIDLTHEAAAAIAQRQEASPTTTRGPAGRGVRR